MLSEMKAAAGETDIHMGGEKRTETLQGRGNRHTLTALLYETLVDKAQGEKYPRDKGDEVLCIILGLKTVPSALCVPMASLSANCCLLCDSNNSTCCLLLLCNRRDDRRPFLHMRIANCKK